METIARFQSNRRRLFPRSLAWRPSPWAEAHGVQGSRFRIYIYIYIMIIDHIVGSKV